MECPSDEELAAFVEGNPAARHLAPHVEGCETCAELVADYEEAFSLRSAATLSEPAAAPPPDRNAPRLGPGAMAGRFVVLHLAGRGGMGEVYAAYDPELDRKVALKLLRVGPGERRDKLLAEARAAARLAHPHVVPVYDVGDADGEAFIAMEYVEGDPLSRWLEREPSSEAILEVFRQAAAGLQAAHDAGLVHRDFKPHNVLIGRDGRARVTDFGLAQTEEHCGGDGSSPAGTPAYMAPEQRSGGPVTHRADQYSFCVALHEALVGERPLDAPTLADGAAEMGSFRQVRLAKLRHVIGRGLERDPSKRWPSMLALASALRGSPRRRSFWIGTIVVATLGVASVAGALADTPQPCTAGSLRVADIWDAGTRDVVENRFGATALPYAEDSWSTVNAMLDAYRVSWMVAYREICEATHVDGWQPAIQLDRRMACLEERRQQLRATVELLVEADSETVVESVHTVAALPAIADCSRPGIADEGAPEPPDTPQARPVEEIRRQLAKIRTLVAAGRYRKALPLAETAVQAADAVGYPPIAAETVHALGRVQLLLGEYDEASPLLSDALWRATAAHHERIAANAALALLYLDGSRRDDPVSGRRWARYADAILERTGRPPAQQAIFLRYLGGLALTEGDYPAAADHMTRSLALIEQSRGPEHPAVADAAGSLATSLFFQQRYSEAREHLERALAIDKATLGATHPSVAVRLEVLAGVAHGEGDLPAAIRDARKSLEIYEAALGPEHVRTANARMTLGTMLETADQLEEALEHHQRAVEVLERSVGPQHSDLATGLDNLGITLYAAGHYPRAKATLERALAVQSRALGTNHPDVAISWSHLGDALRVLGETDQARAAHREALRIRDRAGPPGPVAASLDALARVAEAQADPEQAYALYRRAAWLWSQALGPSHPYVAESLAGAAKAHEQRKPR